MNLPNILTVVRLILAAIFVVCLSIDFPFNETAAFALFLLASVTDYLDGMIARRYGLITDFGKLMDPLADKILMASAFICLMTYGLLPAWAVIVIISREFLITGLRLLASSKGIVLPAEKLGKHKTLWQIVTAGYFLGYLSLQEWTGRTSAAGAQWFSQIGNLLIAVTIILTVYSGLAYFWKQRSLLRDC